MAKSVDELVRFAGQFQSVASELSQRCAKGGVSLAETVPLLAQPDASGVLDRIAALLVGYIKAAKNVFRVRLGGPETTDQIVAGLGFPANVYISQANFRLTPREAVEESEIEIVGPGRGFSEEEGLKFLAEAKLERPTHEHAIRFTEQYGKTTTSSKKPFVVFLHKPWQDPDHSLRVLCLNRDPDDRRLGLSYIAFRFGGDCVLAGVRPRKQTSAS